MTSIRLLCSAILLFKISMLMDLRGRLTPFLMIFLGLVLLRGSSRMTAFSCMSVLSLVCRLSNVHFFFIFSFAFAPLKKIVTLPVLLFSVFVLRMFVLHFPSQTTFKDGGTMCSVASVLACVYFIGTKKDILKLDSSVFEFLMNHGSMMFQSRFKGVGRSLFDVNDVIARIDLKKRFKNIVVSEFGGLTKGTPSDMQTDHCMDLGNFLDGLQDGDVCTITFQGHTSASGRKGGLFWFFDSLQGFFSVSESRSFLFDNYDKAFSHSMEYSAVVLRGRTTE